MRSVVASVLAATLLACTDRPGDQPRPGQPAETDPAHLFAEIDTTLAFAIEQGQLAALQATDVALRAFAVQQVARYEELRVQLQEVSRGLGLPLPARLQGDALQHGERLRALRVTSGSQFDRAYVRQALAVHQDLLADLDAALRLVEDAEVRRALEELRGAVGASAPEEARTP